MFTEIQVQKWLCANLESYIWTLFSTHSVEGWESSAYNLERTCVHSHFYLVYGLQQRRRVVLAFWWDDCNKCTQYAHILYSTQKYFTRSLCRNPLRLRPTAEFRACYCCRYWSWQTTIAAARAVGCGLAATVIYTQFSNSVNRYFAYACERAFTHASRPQA